MHAEVSLQRPLCLHGVFFCGEGPRSRCYGRTAVLRLIVPPCDEDKEKDGQFFLFFQVMGHRWNEIDRGKPKYSGEKPVPVSLCPPQIPRGSTQYRNRASAVGGWRLTAWAMARPSSRVTKLTAYCHHLFIVLCAFSLCGYNFMSSLATCIHSPILFI
jgi:hypothetical protein